MPAGPTTTTRVALPRRASSRPTEPPSELPATATVPSPALSSSAATASASAATVGSPGSTGADPKPGRSSASTSCAAERSPSTGFHDRQLSPSPCSRTSGSPDPSRNRMSVSGGMRSGADERDSARDQKRPEREKAEVPADRPAEVVAHVVDAEHLVVDDALDEVEDAPARQHQPDVRAPGRR